MKKIKHKPVSSKTEKKQVSLLPEFLKEQRTRILLGIALALVSLYILFALIGFFFSGGIDQSLVDGPWGKSLPIRKSKSVILPERSEPGFRTY